MPLSVSPSGAAAGCGELLAVWHCPAPPWLGPWPALLQAGCPLLCSTLPSRHRVDVQGLGGLIILQRSQSAQCFPSLCWCKLGSVGVNAGMKAMLRGLHPGCLTAGGEQCGPWGSPEPNPSLISTLQPPCSLCPPAPGSSQQRPLSPHPLHSLLSLHFMGFLSAPA